MTLNNSLCVGRLQDRIALVTGSASGIGAATVARLCAEGATVLASGLQADLLQEVGRRTGAIALECDVTSEQSVKALVESVSTRFGRLDIVVNVAGIVINDDVASITDECWEQTLSVNLTGTMRVCRAVIPLLVQSGGGAVVNVSSVAAFNASAGMASYAASKAGVLALTRALANRYGGNRIRANCVCPGWVRTPMSEAEMKTTAAERGISVEQAYGELEARLALRRVGEPQEIAAAIAFLASDDASFVTGATLVADGGARTPATARAI
jgi:NAD(P)-dependent dehydrogenase (short-subunit alcohol dehydrogenase family)